MGGLYSKTRRSGSPSPLLQANTSSQLTAHLSSYEDACKEDEKLQSFDATLHGRTNHVIKILADGVELRSLGSFKEVTNSVEIRSLGSFKEVTNCLLDMNQDVVKVILESKEDIWDNPELFGMVKKYFKRSVKTMEFCTALGSSLERAKNSQLILQLAIEQFEEEVEMKDGALDKKFEKTLEGLQKFKAAGDPFTPQYFALFQSVYEQQVSMLKKLESRMKKHDEKLKSMETWRRVSNVLFVSAFISVLIISVLAAAVAAPPVVTALEGAMTVPIGSGGKWCNTLWNRYEKAWEEEKGLVRSIEVGTSVTIKDMVNIRVLVNKFQVEIESLLRNEEDLAVKLVIDEIKTKMAVFMESIEDLAAHAGKCHEDIIVARRVILNRILICSDP
ncbi:TRANSMEMBRANE PROTEIN [Salix koriyanagi]|uniref:TRANSMEMBRANE PROTEIN n=1 Tax=Salix koriyanagi TaxID=2511006 RepID=A0A9Q0ZFW7_9ROSI|nr:TRANSMEMBRANE PROTEIN [Salix koriyanagi]KAJ6732972.1 TRANSMEMBRANE PROTEIN [Salix koriyanagi]